MEVLLYLLKSAGVITLFYGVYALFLKKETFFLANRHFLLAGIMGAFLFPFVQFTKTVVKEVPAMDPTPFENTLTTSSSPELAAMVSQQSPSWFTWEHMLLSVYIIGFLFFFGRFVFQLWNLLRLLGRYPIKREHGYAIMEVPEDIAPFSFFSFIVYNPNRHTRAELEMILQHEKEHAKQTHSVDVLISHFLLMAQWFNPLAWLYKKGMEENLEFMADHFTAKKVPSKKAYQLALVKASSATNMPALTNYFYQSFIKKRIIMLNKKHSKKQNAFKAVFIVPLLALFLWSFNVKEVTEWVTVPSKEKKVDPKTMEEIPLKTTNTYMDADKDMPEEKVVKDAETAPEPELPIREEYRIKITKKTTDAELQQIKEDLKSKFGMDLSYTTVRNNAKEIVSLSMNYNGNGKSGNYQVTDDKGIEEFFFYIDDEGKSGFWSEANEERREEMEIRREKRREDMEERREEMESRREKRREEMEERREEMEVKRTEMDKRRRDLEEETVKEVIILDGDENEEVDEEREYVIARGGNGGNTVAVVSEGYRMMSITKNTSNAQLAQMKEELAQQNISFSYKNVKRNAQGEITGIKFTVDDHKGSKSTTVVKGDDDEPINRIFIQQ